ncbi:3-oxoacyl-[acyl-carrier-protein] synthase III C-terminal domain-containing protein [Agrococcus sp. SCSIO52902]|uniref:3-oxoacyl-ACP synthase III family protein n=1 Tax=Agrococcus sp. SCSIO52902 TaxID=2933290 RepID=UPI001FF474B1|nr:3-oxoacyl-[acyl-carrier-protein] synthase III C-terminal domain-containing protein [Agrococcus sp. SCSIO52902]UOW01094.1 ketoacyl-ACP synthase III [Agrococcus sp. SCSIO52902]
MPSPTSAIVAVGAHLPAGIRTTEQTERRLRDENPGRGLPVGLIRRMTGVDRVHEREPGEQASDLAAHAARRALADSPEPVDLLIFASASQDLIEPATAHIVADRLGLDVPVFDVKNACNSVLNAVQVAHAMIVSGQARRVLIASGETPTSAVRWRLADRHQFVRSFPGYTMSDAGAALVLEAAPSAGPGIVDLAFSAASHHWRIGTLPTGGSMHPRDPEATYFDIDGRGLQRAFLALGPELITDLLARRGVALADVDLVLMHQVAEPHLAPIAERLGLGVERILPTVAEHGNLASATLPIQLRRALDDGLVGPGSLVLLVGLAGGISLGAALVRL